MVLMMLYIVMEIRQSSIKIKGMGDWAFAFGALFLYSIFDIHLTGIWYDIGATISSLLYVTGFIFIQYSLSNYLGERRNFIISMLVGSTMLFFIPIGVILELEYGYWLNILYSAAMILILLETIIFIRSSSLRKLQKAIFAPLCLSLAFLLPYFVGRIVFEYDFGVNHVYEFGTVHNYLYLLNMVLLMSITLSINYIYRWFFISSLQKVNMDLDNQILKVTLLSETDQLTRIANRRKIEDIIKNKVLSLQKGESTEKFSLILLDLDRFKMINDNYGHQTGDDVLITFAELIENFAGDKFACGRWGGDEFIISLSGSDEVQAERFAQDLSQKAKSIQVNHDFELSFSYGIMEYDPRIGYDEFFKNIDTRLYEQKARKYAMAKLTE